MDRIYAPKEFLEVKNSEFFKNNLESCGKLNLKPSLLRLDITVICQIHNYMYFIGKTDKDKDKADRIFLNNTVRFIHAQPKTLLNLILNPFRLKMAVYYYKIFKMYGGPVFWEDKENHDEYGRYFSITELLSSPFDL